MNFHHDGNTQLFCELKHYHALWSAPTSSLNTVVLYCISGDLPRSSGNDPTDGQQRITQPVSPTTPRHALFIKDTETSPRVVLHHVYYAHR